MDTPYWLQDFTPAGAGSDPRLTLLLQQMLARMRARLAQQAPPVINLPGLAPSAPVQMPPPSMPAPAQPTYHAPSQSAPVVTPAPVAVPGVPALGQGGVTPWVAAAYGGAAPTPGTAGQVYVNQMAGLPLFPVDPSQLVYNPDDPTRPLLPGQGTQTTFGVTTGPIGKNYQDDSAHDAGDRQASGMND